MDLPEMLAGVTGYQHRAGRDQAAQQHLQSLRKQFDQAGLVPPGHRVLTSGSAQSLPLVPWIALLNLDVTKTAQEGMYLVYLFDATIENVYLSLNQGVTAHTKLAVEAGHKGVRADAVAREQLAHEATAIREGIEATDLDGLQPSIDLKDTGSLPRAYEAGNIAAISYRTSDLPPAPQMLADLNRMLELYKAGVEIKLSLASQALVKTSPVARNATRNHRDKVAIFAPKDSSDYLAKVQTHIQHRSRNHENLIDEFGKAVITAGGKPATNVHPRDLTVEQHGQHWLVEAKTVGANTAHAVREAVGQLFEYRHFFYPDQATQPHLLALFNSPVGAALEDYLQHLGIEHLAKTATGWTGSQRATELIGAPVQHQAAGPTINHQLLRPTQTPPNQTLAARVRERLNQPPTPADMEYQLAGAMVGHRLAGGQPEEVDSDLARLVGDGQITTEDAIDHIKHDMGITAGQPRHA